MPNPAVAALLTIDIEQKGGVAFVRCHGKLIACVCEQLYAKVCPLIPDNKRIVLDLGDVNQMDSMGLGTLVRLYVSCKSGGTSLELLHVGKRIRELLGITHLLNVFTIIGESGIKLGF
jgi:anti-sigma B factor antagonist